MKLYSLSEQELTQNINTGVEIVLKQLCRDGKLGAEDLSTYRVVLGNPSIFGKLWKKLWGDEDSILILVKYAGNDFGEKK